MSGKSRDASVKVAIALSALLVGVALGYWSGSSDRGTAKVIEPAKTFPSNDRNLTSKVPTPLPDRRSAETARKESQHPRPDALAEILQERKQRSSARHHELCRGAFA